MVIFSSRSDNNGGWINGQENYNTGGCELVDTYTGVWWTSYNAGWRFNGRMVYGGTIIASKIIDLKCVGLVQ